MSDQRIYRRRKMNIEMFLTIFAALCAFRAFDFMVFSWSSKPKKKIFRTIEVQGTDELPDYVKEAIIRKLQGEDDDDQ